MMFQSFFLMTNLNRTDQKDEHIIIIIIISIIQSEVGVGQAYPF